MTSSDLLRIDVRLDRYDAPVQSFTLQVTAELPASGVTVLFGPSGSGKTSLLRCIAGLEPSCSGEIALDKDVWQSTSHNRPPHLRNIGYVFQDGRLFEHMTVSGNLDYAKKRALSAVTEKFEHQVIEALDIEPLLNKAPLQLSGGQIQRVSIARALLSAPKLLLMDEPLASLDHQAKQQILSYIEVVQQRFGIPVIYVTHEVNEALRLADHIVLMDDGKAIKSGTAKEMWDDIVPVHSEAVVWEGIVSPEDSEWHLMRLTISGINLFIADTNSHVKQKARVKIAAKDVSITLTEATDSSILNRYQAEILSIEESAQSSMALLSLDVSGQKLLSKITRKSAAQLNLRVGQSVWVQIKSASLIS